MAGNILQTAPGREIIAVYTDPCALYVKYSVYTPYRYVVHCLHAERSKTHRLRVYFDVIFYRFRRELAKHNITVVYCTRALASYTEVNNPVTDSASTQQRPVSIARPSRHLCKLHTSRMLSIIYLNCYYAQVTRVPIHVPTHVKITRIFSVSTSYNVTTTINVVTYTMISDYLFDM